MKKLAVVFSALSIFLTATACKEKSSKPKQSSIDGSPGPSSAEGGSDQTCAKLTTLGMDAAVQGLVQRLCGSGVKAALLQRAFMGKGDQPYVELGRTDLGSAQVRAAVRAALNIDGVSPVNYFAVVKKSALTPTEFANQGYQYDPDTEYTILAGSTQTLVNYKFKNDKQKAEGVVHFDAVSEFKEIVPGELYVVTARLTKSYETVTGFTGLQVIQKRADGAGVEVYAMADQDFKIESESGRNTAVENAKTSYAQEMLRAFNNAKKGP